MLCLYYKKNIYFCSLVFLMFFTSACTKKHSTPLPDGKTEKVKNINNKNSTFFRNLGKEPETLHPIRSADAYASVIQDEVLDSLLIRDLDTYEWQSHLAEKWEVDKDYKTFTFKIRPNIKWHDGKPLTVKDVAFSFKAYKDPSFGGAHFLPYLENIESVEILDEHRVRFKASKKYFNTLSVLGDMAIIPEHIYKDKEKKLSRILMGSGPYILKRYEKGKKIVLEQNENWWGRSVKPNIHRIKRVVYRFISDDNDQLIRMAAGDLDFLGMNAEAYMKKTNTPPWGDSIIKKEIRNKLPAGYNYIAWNFKNTLFQGKKTRKALNHLMNRTLMNKKFLYGKSKLATGPWYSWSDYADSSTSPVLFDSKRAGRLLEEEGWKDTDKNGVLDKIIEGKKREFKFTLLFPNKDFEKYLTIYQQDLKKSGIEMSLRFMDWSAFLKLVNEKKFEAVSLAWSGGYIDNDPKQIWHSESAREGGHNFISYSNPEVDKLIDEGRKEISRDKRMILFKKVYRLIAEDYPYLFLYNTPVRFYAHSKKVKIEKDTYNYGLGIKYWELIGDF